MKPFTLQSLKDEIHELKKNELELKEQISVLIHHISKKSSIIADFRNEIKVLNYQNQILIDKNELLNMSLTDNRRYYSAQEMRIKADTILKGLDVFTSSEFWNHCEKKGISRKTAGSMIHKLKHSRMIFDIGKDENSNNGRLYQVSEYWKS